MAAATNTVGFKGGFQCTSPDKITGNGLWSSTLKSYLDLPLPIFLIQVVVIVGLARLVAVALRPLRQPRVVSEIITGIILGPTLMGHYWPDWATTMFSMKSLPPLEIAAHIGLVYFLFSVGLEIDLNVIKRTGRKALVIGAAGIAVPFVIGFGVSYTLVTDLRPATADGTIGSAQLVAFHVFLAAAFSITAMPVMARMLSELKLLNTDLGRIAMSSAIVSDLIAWVFLAMSAAMANSAAASDPDVSKKHFLVPPGVSTALCTVAFVLACYYLIRPAVTWLSNQTPEGEMPSIHHIAVILIGVALAGVITDSIGIHVALGPFLFGLVFPDGPLAAAIQEMAEAVFHTLLLPLFFVSSGLRTRVEFMIQAGKVLQVLGVFTAACVAKVATTTLIGLFYTMPFHESFSLGILMNCKGLLELVVLRIGMDKKLISNEYFTILVVASMMTTVLVGPVVMATYVPWKRRQIGYKRRNLQRSKPDTELRMLACVHNTRNVSSIISLLEASNPTKRSPVFVYALHLIELAGRSTAMLIVHNTNNKQGTSGGQRKSRGGGQAQSDHIVAAFENYEQHAGGVSVQALTAISPYSSMHEDVCSLAEDKRVALIVLPFHKQQTADGGMEATNPGLRSVNEQVLANAPCSVAILVDRGIGGTARFVMGGQQVSHHVGLLFFGGPDDREALAYAWRMAEHPGTSLTIVRFLPTNTTPAVPDSPSQSSYSSRRSLSEERIIAIPSDETDRERQLDDEYLNEFRLRNASDESVVYVEKMVRSGEDTVAVIRAMDSNHDLYIVGRGHGQKLSPLTAGLADWSDCPELGPVGDFLSSSDLGRTVSVLVMQQYLEGAGAAGGAAAGGEGEAGGPESPTQQYLVTHRLKVRPSGISTGWNASV